MPNHTFNSLSRNAQELAEYLNRATSLHISEVGFRDCLTSDEWFGGSISHEELNEAVAELNSLGWLRLSDSRSKSSEWAYLSDAVNAFADSAIYLSISGERELSAAFYHAWAHYDAQIVARAYIAEEFPEVESA
jgi:hypothetical protein